jgi:predicted DCC family thiol-disulfide oxidoreductase YuxK
VRNQSFDIAESGWLTILVYDSGCGPCTDFRNVVGFLDPRRRITFMSLAEADRLHLLNPIASNLRYRSFHLLAHGKNVMSGAAALPELFGLLPGGKITKRVLQRAPFSFRIVSSAYRALSRLHDSGSCNTPLGNPEDAAKATLEYAQNPIKTIK